MIEGLLRHCTDAEIDTSYGDTTARAWSGSRSPSCSGSGYCHG
jgi:TnpA family transposase